MREGYKLHGPKFPVVVTSRFATYIWRRSFGPKSFSLGGKTYAYEIHPFILDNERTVEIGLARGFLSGRPGPVLEVGNVLSAYMTFPHDVVDKYERAPGVINEDIVTYNPRRKYPTIISLSTLEHVGWDETPREPAKIELAIQRLVELLAPGGELMVTMPVGYNAHLDQMLANKDGGFSEVRFLRRISSSNRWQEAPYEEVRNLKYGQQFPCGNAVVVGIFRK